MQYTFILYYFVFEGHARNSCRLENEKLPVLFQFIPLYIFSYFPDIF